jgi:hypothetical protein
MSGARAISAARAVDKEGIETEASMTVVGG